MLTVLRSICAAVAVAAFTLVLTLTLSLSTSRHADLSAGSCANAMGWQYSCPAPAAAA